MTTPSVTLTNESITLILEGKTYVVQKGTANFDKLRKAVFDEDWAAAKAALTVAKTIEQWAKGDFTVKGEVVSYQGQPLPSELNTRIVAMAAEGSDPRFLMRFWERLQNNPSWRSVKQLYPFLEHQGIPIDKDGCFLAYKAVRGNYLDFHSGTILNKPGEVITYPRNKISDDPEEACHEGLHVGALEYARSFGDDDRRIVICKVDPADVVCIPYDASQRKMRVCKYHVIGNHGARLPDTVIEDTEVEETPKRDFDQELQDEATEAAKQPKAQPILVDSWDNSLLDLMDEVDLLDQNIDVLRKYAAHKLKIVGASKIPGGKRVLVQRIIDVRRP